MWPQFTCFRREGDAGNTWDHRPRFEVFAEKHQRGVAGCLIAQMKIERISYTPRSFHVARVIGPQTGLTEILSPISTSVVILSSYRCLHCMLACCSGCSGRRLLLSGAGQAHKQDVGSPGRSTLFWSVCSNPANFAQVFNRRGPP